MCGIFGISCQKKVDGARIIRDGLKRLEYRGYDSWGIAVLDDIIETQKAIGAIPDKLPQTMSQVHVGIGHTRWATHGGVTLANAHPHVSNDGSFSLAHNGIVENFDELKGELVRSGRTFVTQTDTEVIVGMLENELVKVNATKNAFEIALPKVFKRLQGRNTIAVVTNNGELLAARNGSPLVVGKKDSDFFVASDTLSVSAFASEMLAIDNGDMVVIANGKIKLVQLRTGTVLSTTFSPITLQETEIDTGGFAHYMLKEIHETPKTLQSVSAIDRKKLQEFSGAVRKAKGVYVIGSGTAGIAAAQIAYFLRFIAKIPAKSLVGAEAGEYMELFTKGDILLAPSQSGETADVLEVLEAAKAKGVTIATFVNMPGSSMERLSDFSFSAHAGPEICVMSTKVYSSMQAFGYLLAHAVNDSADLALDQLKKAAQSIQTMLANEALEQDLKKLARALAHKEHILLLGKGENLSTVSEGMVKIIEGSYKHAHAIAAGDLKHYAITLIEPGVPVLFVIPNDESFKAMLNAVHEVKARGGDIIALAPHAHESFDTLIPIPDVGEASSLVAIVPLQLLAYYMAIELGNNVDKPRNIAKSVTVK
jgi:glucosamine--fructose-6-phosphate aminotransferase (isomerizing)